jgi:hypothetical protein
MFENLNNLGKLTFLQADSPEGLEAQIKSIRLPVRILSLYFADGMHVAWIMTDAIIVKQAVPKGKAK